MGHSSVSFREQSICAKDYKIEVWLFLAVREINQLPEIPSWLQEACAFWREQAELHINGCIDPDLDRFLTNEERLQVVCQIAQCVHESLTVHGDKLSKNFLNQLCNGTPPNVFYIDNDTELYLKLSSAIIKLLEGRQAQQLDYA